MKKIFNWIGNILLGLLLILVILTFVGKLTKSNTILGFTPLKVLSGSMEPDIKIGDLIVVKNIDESSIEEGDIITFKTNPDTFVTHRVVEVFNQNGDIAFKTKGDANNIEDRDLVSKQDIVGKYVFRLPAFGYFSDFVSGSKGFILLFVLPISILLGKEIINFSKA